MIIKTPVWYEVSIGRPYEMEALWDILTNIAALTSRGQIIWEARCAKGKMRYLLGVPKWSAGRIMEVFSAHSEARFTEITSREPVILTKTVRISKPVLQLNIELSSAMIRSALAAMTGGSAKGETVVQVILGAAHSPKTISRNMPSPNDTWLNAILGSVHNASPEQRRSAKEKAEQYSFDALIRVGISGEHTATCISNIVSAMRTLESAGAHLKAEKERPDLLNKATLPWRMPLKLSVKEVACFMLLPVGEEELPGTPGLHPKLLLPPKWYKEPNVASCERKFAVTLDCEPRTLSISPKDALEHLCILGPTGSGKSVIMEHLALADICAGRSVLVIDPKADLVTNILERIPDERKKDVIVIDPSDSCPTGFNPLAYKQNPTLTADVVLAVLQEIFSENWGIRSADVLSGALQTLVHIKDANLLWLPRLLTDEEFRKSITAQIIDPVALQPFWSHFEAMRESERRTEIAPVLNKLRQFSYRPYLRSVLGQSKPKFSLSDLFFQRKIVLVPLNRGVIGAESAKLLGSLIAGLTWSLALSRANIPPEKRHIVSIYIDELQDYIALPTSFNDALAQARGLGVAYAVAHQYRKQLSSEIRAGIDANCRNKIVFGLRADDAKDMAAEAPKLTPQDFMTLPRYQIYTTFQSGGRNTGWISGRTLPPAPPLRMAAELKAESMAHYGVSSDETEEALIALMGHSAAENDRTVIDAPIGRKKRNERSST